MIFLPEIRLMKVTQALIKYLQKDLAENIANETENESHLYLLFHENSFDENSSVNYTEAKEIFTRKEADPRYLKVSPIFDRRRAAIPTVHIVVPQDIEELRQIGDIEGVYNNEDGYLRDMLGRAFQTQFNLIVTSDNINEVIYINYVLRALFLGAIPFLEEIGFIKPEFGTQDLNINPELLPANAYMKGILMTAGYFEIVPEVTAKNPQINNIVFNINQIIY